MPGPISIAHNNVEAGYSPVVYNLTLTNANQEYSQALPGNVRKFSVRPRSTSNTIKLAFNSGESSSLYISIDSIVYYEDLIGANALTLYMQSTTAGAIVEIVAWS